MKRRRKRRERKQRLLEEERQRQIEEDERRGPVQHVRDGVIHIETNHPRSSIIIIRSNSDLEESKKAAKESSFSLPQFSYTDGKHVDENENDVPGGAGERLNEEYHERTEFIDCVEGESEVVESNVYEKGDSQTPVQNASSSGSSSSKRKRGKSGKNKQFVKADQTTDAYQQNENDGENKSSHIGNHGNHGSHDDDKGDDSDASDEEKPESGVYESCLYQLCPGQFAEKYDRLRLYEKLADVFMVCLGVRATQRLGPTGFRTFARKCRLNKRGLNNASIDILFIDMQRKWEHVNPERTTGLGFRGFLDACHEIARRKFQNGDMLQTMQDFIDYCQENLQDDQLFQVRCNPRLLTRRARPHGYPLLEPMITSIQSHTPPILDQQTELFIENRLNSGKYSKPTSADDVNFFLQQRHRQLNSLKSHKRSKSRTKDRDER